LLREGRKMLQIGAPVRELKAGLQAGRDIGVEFIRTASRMADSVRLTNSEVTMAAGGHDCHQGR
jgi:hypothetical protein